MDTENKKTNTAYDAEKIRYGLDADIPLNQTIVYGLQNLLLFVTYCAIVPVVVAKGLGLDSAAISEMLLRTFFVCGVLSILNARFGHRYPLLDGPSGLWLSVWINLASITSVMGGDLSMLRTHLEFGMIVAGLIVVGVGFSGFMKHIVKLFTPMINGLFLMLMPIQISKSCISGMFGVVYGGDKIDNGSFAVFCVTVAATVLVSVFGAPFIKSIAILIAVVIGWIFASVIGVGDFGNISELPSVIVLPELFAWGIPTYDPGILITCIVGSFLLFTNCIGSYLGMADLLEEKFTDGQLDRAIVFTGVSTITTGAFATLGFVPFATSIGIIRMSGVASRKPFYIASAAMIVLGVLAPVGIFFAAIPSAVGYGAVIVLFSVVFKQGTDFIRKAGLTERRGLALGISMLTGTGIMMQPFSLFTSLPAIIVPFVSNGLLVGIILSIVLEQALKDRCVVKV